MRLSLAQALRICKPRRAANDSGPRKKEQIKWVVLHSTEGGTAESVAAFFSRPSTQASTHLVVDDKECWRMRGTVFWMSARKRFASSPE